MLHEATMKKIEHLKKNVEVSKTIKKEAIQVTFPQEIIIEILSWMPVKSLLRMKCSCKQWCALIQDRHFIEKHLSRLSLRPTIHNNRVLKGHGGDHEGWEVLTIREDNSRRPLFPNLQRCGTELQKSPGPMVVSAGLAVHCVSIIEFCSRFVAELVSFGLESETFTTVVLPHRLFLNGNDSIEDLVPLDAKSGELWFWLKTNEIIGCDLETMKITAIVSADAERDNSRVRFYRGPPVLVTLKGMRSYR
ncbi:hypothetical protein DKX38_016925 [Salix brachista]|uniref:F-box domain-containing protein n=1 Tax=Salix brachista TaxID=2182728 RepID=A0A5N5KTW1_9ROSI|nr:hypothetical protein DKX38_016925 [Salix brachista]